MASRLVQRVQQGARDAGADLDREALAPPDPSTVEAHPANLIEFVAKFRPGYRITPVHEHIAAMMQHALARDCRQCLRPRDWCTGDGHEYAPLDRLMVFVPPQTGKTEIVSVAAPAWYLGEHPDSYWVAASYGLSLAQRNGRLTKNTVQSEAYQQHYDARLDPSKTAAAEWEVLNHRGGFYGVGVGGGLTGRPADVIVVDDPVKDRAQADSEVYRKRDRQWWRDVADTRVHPQTIVIVVMTRWHHADLAGYVLNGDEDTPGEGRVEDGGRWRVVRIPAIADTVDDPLGRAVGDPLMTGPVGYVFPTRQEALDWWELKRRGGARTWAALYQQTPSLDEGAILRDSYWRWYDLDKPLPRSWQAKVQTWDTAFTEDEANDFNASLTFGLEKPEGDIYLLDGLHERLEFPALTRLVETQATIHKPTLLSVEAKASGKPLVQQLKRKITAIKEWSGGKMDKVARAYHVQPILEQSRCLLPYRTLTDGSRWTPPWVTELLLEAGQFPLAEHDDYVDALTQGLIEIAALERAIAAQNARKSRRRASDPGIDARYRDKDTGRVPSPELVRRGSTW